MAESRDSKRKPLGSFMKSKSLPTLFNFSRASVVKFFDDYDQHIKAVEAAEVDESQLKVEKCFRRYLTAKQVKQIASRLLKKPVEVRRGN